MRRPESASPLRRWGSPVVSSSSISPAKTRSARPTAWPTPRWSRRPRLSPSTRRAACRCRSHYEEVARPDRARIRYLDEAGERREIEVEGMLATCIQHEIDHLDGILFVDHISKLKRDMIMRKLTKAKRAEATAGA